MKLSNMSMFIRGETPMPVEVVQMYAQIPAMIAEK
jgi:hypothetical protein